MQDLVTHICEKTGAKDLSIGLCKNHHILTFVPKKDVPFEELGLELFLNQKFFDKYPCGKFCLHYYTPSQGNLSLIVNDPEKPWSMRKINGVRQIKPVTKTFSPPELEKAIPNKDGLVAPLLHNRVLVLIFEDIASRNFRMDPWIVAVPHLKAYLNGRAYDPDNHGLFIADGDHTYYMVESEENDNKIAFVFHDRKFEIPGHTALIISAKEALGDDDPDLLIKRLFNLSRDKLIDQETLHDGVFTKIKDRTTSHVAATIMGVGIKETNPVTYILEPIVPEGFGYKASNALRITTDNLAPLVTPEKVKVRGRIAIPRDLGIFIQAVDQIEVGGLDLAYIYGEKNTEGNITLIVDGKETKVRTPFLLLKRNQLEKTIRELSENHELLNAIHQNCDIFRRTLAEKQYNGLDFFMAAMILLRETNGAYPWNSKQLKKWAERAAQTSEVHIERLKGVKDGKYMKKEVAKPIQEAIEFLQEDRKKLIEVIYANIAN